MALPVALPSTGLVPAPWRTSMAAVVVGLELADEPPLVEVEPFGARAHDAPTRSAAAARSRACTHRVLPHDEITRQSATEPTHDAG